MKFRKISFVSSKKPEALEALKKLEKLYKNFPPNEADVIVALGGDGTVLKSLHNFLENKIPIYGMNRGFVGFLMNQYSEKKLEKRLSEAIPYKLHPLLIKSFDKNGKIREGLAFNDVSMIRNSPRIAKIKVQVNNKTRIEEFLGDGCLISTPAGSSAYNLSLRGPVIPVGAKVLALTPISPYRPRRWRGKIVGDKAVGKADAKSHPATPAEHQGSIWLASWKAPNWDFRGVLDDIGVFNTPLKANTINNIMRDGLEKASAISLHRKITVVWGKLKKHSFKQSGK